jgi:hypothetical protein
MSSGRPQKGRKPRKHWHRQENVRVVDGMRRWPTTDRPTYDGEPTPLRQGMAGKSRRKLKGARG